MKRVYIAGPIAGHPGAKAIFAAAASGLSAGGYYVVNPFDLPPYLHQGDCPPGYDAGEDSGHTSACHMKADLRALLRCDALYALPGWENSRGATVEVAVAKACGMEVIYADGSTYE